MVFKNIEGGLIDKFDIGDAAQSALALFTMLAIYASPTITPETSFQGFLLLLLGFGLIFFVNFGLSLSGLRKTISGDFRTRFNKSSDIALKHILAGLIISFILILILSSIFEPGAFSSISTYLTSVSNVAFVVGIATASVVDTLKD